MKKLNLYSGAVRGGSGESTDPPKILEPIEEKLETETLSWFSSIPIPLGQKPSILIPLCVIPNVASVKNHKSTFKVCNFGSK